MAREDPPAVPSLLGTQRRLTRLLEWFAVPLTVLLAVISWVLAATLSGDAYERAFAICASVAASALWWALLARIVEREMLALVRTEVADERIEAERRRASEHELLQSMLDRYVNVRDGIPAAVYPGRNGWDLRYNRDLDRHLAETTEYVFHGPTGVYVGARLRLRPADRELRLVEVMITDPTSAGAMKVAVHDRLERTDHVGKSHDEVHRELHDDIFMAVIALFDARRHAGRIRLMHERRARARIELFDDALYEAEVGTPERKNFTTTLAWEASCGHYRARAQELRDAQRSSRFSIAFGASSPETELYRHLKRLGFDVDRVPELRRRYNEHYVQKLQRVLEQARSFSEDFDDAWVPDNVHDEPVPA